VTWWKPEAIWFVGKYPVHICEPRWCGYVPATIYVVQDGGGWLSLPRLRLVSW